MGDELGGKQSQYYRVEVGGCTLRGSRGGEETINIQGVEFYRHLHKYRETTDIYLKERDCMNRQLTTTAFFGGLLPLQDIAKYE